MIPIKTPLLAAGCSLSDERVLDIPPFIRDIPDDKYHAMEIENFSMKYNLGITAESLGMQPGDYSGITWQKKNNE